MVRHSILDSGRTEWNGARVPTVMAEEGSEEVMAKEMILTRIANGFGSGFGDGDGSGDGSG